MTRAVKKGPEVPSINAAQVAVNYAHGVVTGTVIAGKLVLYACKRFLEDLSHGAERGLEFRPEEAQKIVNFFGLLKHSKGEWGNHPFILEPWQVFILANLFGWYRAASGTRRFTEAYIEVARKNGKTTFLAGIGLYLLVLDNEPGAEIYSAATKKDQARILFEESARMCKASPLLAKRVQAFGQKAVNQLYVESTASKFLPLSSDDNTLDGLNIHGGLIDELHAHPDRRLYDVLYEATKVRRQPMIIAITTAGYDKSATSICWNKRGHTESILQGTVSNAADNFDADHVFGFIACLDAGDNYFDERNWPKANPNLEAGVVKIRGLREAASGAKADATALNSFLRKHMNIWTSQDTKWMDPDKWALCTTAGRNTNLLEVRAAALAALAGRKCFGGLDLSSNIDLTAYVLVFPPVDKAADPRWHILGWYWLPENTLPERVKRDRVPYDAWAQQGFLETTSGNVVDYDVIQERITETKKKFSIQGIGFDSWHATQLVLKLEAEGLKMTQVAQVIKSYNEPMKETTGLTLNKEIEHYGDPVLAWAMNNVAAYVDTNGNMKPDKDKAKEKIDPAVALLMAMGRALASPMAAANPYDERGIIFI